jgi:hypothetical protein
MSHQAAQPLAFFGNDSQALGVLLLQTRMLQNAGRTRNAGNVRTAWARPAESCPMRTAVLRASFARVVLKLWINLGQTSRMPATTAAMRVEDVASCIQFLDFKTF